MLSKRSQVRIRARLRPLLAVAHSPGRIMWRWIRDGPKAQAGEWQWLQDKPVPLGALNRKLWRASNPTLNYNVLIAVSAIISTVGLLAGSTATIIGAMIVAPLMGPISGMAFAMSVGNRRLLKHSSLALFIGVVVTVSVAYIIAMLSGLHSLNEEILARVRPTLLDLIVALAAGAAGAFAKAKHQVADALPGVAIAVALAPPLCVVGIGLAMQSRIVAQGSTLLFLTNLAGILLSGMLVFVWQEYGSFKKARQGLILAGASLIILGLPLGFSLRELIIEAKARNLVNILVRRQTLTFGDTNIRTLRVDMQENKGLNVKLEVAAPQGTITQKQVKLVRNFLEQRLERSISLDVRVIPVEEFSVPSPEFISE